MHSKGFVTLLLHLGKHFNSFMTSNLHVGIALLRRIPGFPRAVDGVDPLVAINATINSTLRMYMDVRRKE